MIEYDKLRVTDLKKLCKEKGLAISGTKSELVARLQIATDDDADDDLLNDDGLGDASVDDDDAEVDEDDDEVELKDPLPKDSDLVSTEAKLTKPVLIKSDLPGAVPAATIKKPSSITAITPAAATPKIGFPETVPVSVPADVEHSKPMTAEEKLAKRAERFGGAVSENAMKSIRAQRFGLTDSSTKSATVGSSGGLASAEKLKQRGERFGISAANSAAVTSSGVGKPAASKPEDVEKLKQRAERFGSVTSTTLSKVDSQEKLLKRKMRFGAITSGGMANLDSDDAKKRRAERFGITA